MTIEPEQWRPVIGWEAQYEVSNLGRVRSLDRLIPAVNRDGSGRMNRLKGRLLKGTPDRDGYLKVNLRNGTGAVSTRMIHTLVLEAWIGPRPLKHDVCHGAGGTSDNSLANLRYDTRSANEADKRRWPQRRSA
jgi:hypothetical protein